MFSILNEYVQINQNFLFATLLLNDLYKMNVCNVLTEKYELVMYNVLNTAKYMR